MTAPPSPNIAFPTARLITLEKFVDARGNLIVAESSQHVPFPIARVYCITQVPENSTRGGHSHQSLEQILIPLHGGFEVSLDNGINRVTYLLNDSAKGLYIPPLHWRTIQNFSKGAICLVLASQSFNEMDYCRNYSQFLSDRSPSHSAPNER